MKGLVRLECNKEEEERMQEEMSGRSGVEEGERKERKRTKGEVEV